MFDWNILGVYLVLFTTVTFSLGGLVLGVIKKDYLLWSIYLGPRRVVGLAAGIGGFLFFIIFGAISFLIITAILNNPALSLINYLLLGVSILGPFVLILWKYKQPVVPPKNPYIKIRTIFVISLMAIVVIVLFFLFRVLLSLQV